MEECNGLTCASNVCAVGCYSRSRSGCIGLDGWQEPLRRVTGRRQENRADVVLGRLHVREKITPIIVAMPNGRADKAMTARTLGESKKPGTLGA